MENDHVVESVEAVKNGKNSVFTLFGDLTGEKNQNPKYCVDLLAVLLGRRFSVGSSDNFEYSIKRIVKSLGSARLHSQCGSFACLTCVLKHRICSVQEVLGVLEKEELRAQGATKAEMKALNTASVLACGAIVHSGAFADESPTAQKFILEKMIVSGKKKSYLFTIACTFLVDVILLSDEKQFKNTIWPVCRVNVIEESADYNVDSYYLLAVCMSKSPTTFGKYLRKSNETTCSFLDKMVNFLFSHSIKSSHPIYGKIAEILCGNVQDLLLIWPKCVEEYAMHNAIKHNLLISLFYHIMKHLRDCEAVPHLLLPKFVDTLVTVLSYRKGKVPEGDECPAKARASLTSLEVLLKDESTSQHVRWESIKKFLLFPSNMKFELKTGNRLVQHLIHQLNAETTKQLLTLLKQIITDQLQKVIIKDGKEFKENWNVKEKRIALTHLTRTINHPSIRNDGLIRLEQIKFIFDIGFLGKDGAGVTDLTKHAKECFFKAIMLPMPSLKELIALLDKLADHVNRNISAGVLDVAQQVKHRWVRQFSVVETLRHEPNYKFFIAVHLLLLYMGFQLFADVDLAKESIEELLSCYARLRSSDDDAGTRGKKNKTGDLSEEPHWTEVTVDLILSLLSRENRLWRRVISCIFPQVVVHATPTTLRQIIDALDPSSQNVIIEEINSDSSEDEKMKAGDDDDECDNDEDEDEEDEEEGKEPGCDDDDDDDDDDDTESTECTDSELEDNNQDDKANDQLRLAVREALGYSAALTDDESVDMDEMDEKEERRLNEDLGRAFSLYKSGSRGRKRKRLTKGEEALMHFRLRVLDLIDIYAANGPSMEGCLELIMPLLNLLEFSIRDQHQGPLRTRVDSVLRNVSAVRNFSGVNAVAEDRVLEVFRAVLGKKDVPALVLVEMSPRISECTGFLVRCSQTLTKGDPDPVLTDEYDALLRAFFRSRDFKLPVAMFQTVLRMSWRGNFKLAATLFDHLPASDVRIFKKMKALELLKIFYKNEKLHGSADESAKAELTRSERDFVKALAAASAGWAREKDAETKATQKLYLPFFSQTLLLLSLMRANASKHRAKGKRGLVPWQDQAAAVVAALAADEAIAGNKRTRSQVANLASTLGVVMPTPQAPVGGSGGNGSADRKRKPPREAEAEAETEGTGSREEEGEDFGESKKKKKRKTNSFIKEGRRLREKLSSTEPELIRFSSVDLKKLPDPNDDDSPP